MKVSIRFLLVGAFACLIVGAAAIYFDQGRQATAGAPDYWITIDSAELDHLRKDAASSDLAVRLEPVESREGISIIKLDELGSQALSGSMHGAFHKCAGFMRHESLEAARRSIEASLRATSDLQLVDYTIDNEAAVVPMIAEAAEPNVRQTIIDLSALPNRRHNLQGGLDGANMILTKWRNLVVGRSDISVTPYGHFSPTNPDVFLTQQPSIVMTIQGTEFPDEIVVLGGHQDSINGSNSTGAAPGADDDASGIASLTEAIRVIVAKGFRPKRTIQFMAYAAEEVGLIGSNNIAQNYRAQNKNVIGVMQLDMTNYSGNWADIVMITDNTNAAQNQFIRDLAAEYLPTLVVKDDACGYGCSDHKSWHDQNYPASMPFEAKFSNTGAPRQYNTLIHTTSDTIARSNNNANHAVKFTKLALSFAGELAKGSIAQAAPEPTKFDFDGDGKADVSVFRSNGGVWHTNNSTAGYSAIPFGLPTDQIVPADFDGDGKTDVAVYRDGIWHLLRSQAGYTSVLWGLAGDIPQPEDFDGDGTADIAVFRPSNGTWYILRSSGGSSIYRFGLNGDRAVASDFDGDGVADAAVYRGGIWHVLGSNQGYYSLQFGIATDTAMTGDFDGDGKADPTVFRGGVWYSLRSAGGVSIIQWGLGADVPAAGDFDGDGKADIAVYRGGVWYIINSSNGSYRIELFGLPDDEPASAAYIQP
ncbi:MAG: M20/M25/M40 family metallo-hydrolase [Blastocatellia bacterium]|nr:M20/M25/M40 family metallo-hydrolase [Blastocatellia bacterium]